MCLAGIRKLSGLPASSLGVAFRVRSAVAMAVVVSRRAGASGLNSIWMVRWTGPPVPHSARLCFGCERRCPHAARATDVVPSGGRRDMVPEQRVSALGAGLVFTLLFHGQFLHPHQAAMRPPQVFTLIVVSVPHFSHGSVVRGPFGTCTTGGAYLFRSARATRLMFRSSFRRSSAGAAGEMFSQAQAISSNVRAAPLAALRLRLRDSTAGSLPRSRAALPVRRVCVFVVRIVGRSSRHYIKSVFVSRSFSLDRGS